MYNSNYGLGLARSRLHQSLVTLAYVQSLTWYSISSTYNRIEQTLDGRVLVRIIHVRRTASFEVAAVRGSLERFAAPTNSAVDAELKERNQYCQTMVGVLAIIQK